MKLLKQTVKFAIIGAFLATLTPAFAAVQTIWGAPHASVVATNRIPVDASALSGPGYNSVGDILNLISGDCTVNITSGAITCTKTGGVSFAAIATSGSASDISTGTLAAARLPNPSTSTLGGVEAINHVGSQWVSYIDTSGVPHLSKPQDADIAFADIVTGNVSASAHGFVKKLPNSASVYYDGTGNFSSLSAGLSGLLSFTGDGTVLSNTPSTGATMSATLATAASHTFLGNGSAGTAAPTYLTASQVTSLLNPFTGDSGSGGLQGVVPQPSAGDAALNKFLSASGIWTVPSGGGNVSGPVSSSSTAIPLYADTTGKVIKNSGVLVDTSNNLTANTLISTVATGTAPLTVSSTTQVANLNAATAGTLNGALSANQLLGSLTAVAPTGQTVPSCSTTASALMWTSGSGFSCNTAVAAPASALTGNTLASGVTASSVTSVGALASGSLTTGFTTVAAAQGGTGQTTIANAFTSFFESVATTLGDIVYGAGSGAPTRLAGNTTTTPQFLTSTGSGGLATAPTWTGSSGSGSVCLTTSCSMTTPALGTPSAVVLTNASGTASSLTAGTATNAVNTGITDDTSTNATMDLTWVTSNSGNLPQKTTSTKLTFNPSTGVLSSTSFTGAGTGLTGTAASLTAGTVTTNANLTGVITSSGNATSIGAQTGTGTTFVTSVSPALTGSPTAPTQTNGDNTTDIATDAFVQSAISSQVDMHDPVVVATTAVLSNSPVYSNGSSGVGATLTAGSVGVLTVDGVIPTVGQRILVQNQAASLQNGCYTLTTAGVLGTVDYVLTRCTDFNTAAQVAYGDTFPVLQGTANANQQFTMNSQTFTTFGAAGATGTITFAQTSGGSQLSAGTGITITGNSVALTTPVTIGNGGTGAASLTNHGVVTAGASALTTIAPGTSGNVLQSNGTDWTSAAAAGSSEVVLLATGTASGSASLTFTSDISSSYDYYIFVIRNIVDGSAGILQLQASADNGTTWTAGLNWQLASIATGANSSPTLTGGTNPANITLGSSTTFNGKLELVMPTVSGTQYAIMRGSTVGTGGNFCEVYINTNSGSSINAIRFIPSTGTITSGSILMYGVKNT